MRTAIIESAPGPIEQVRSMVRAHVRSHADYPMLATVANQEMHVLSAELAALIPGSRIALIPEAGHLTNLERPAEFNRALDDFLAEVEATP